MNEFDLEIIDILKLQKNLKDIYLTPFFNKQIINLIDLINQDINSVVKDKKDIFFLKNYKNRLFLIISFLRGSVNKLIPYEVIFVVEQILKNEINQNIKILTKMLDDFNYCIYRFQVSDLFNIPEINEKYIIMGLPETWPGMTIKSIFL
ncbi:MAG: hypothetical protein WC002_10150 [Candidatus Muiribacteriota bacterium]|jgi:hypothetical protein